MPRRRKDRVTITDAKRRAIVEEMLRLQYLDYRSLAECWKLTHPEFDGKSRSAEVMARDEITWYYNSYATESEKYLRQLFIMRTDEILTSFRQRNDGQLGLGYWLLREARLPRPAAREIATGRR